ncbi:hypothetical protein K440DRAFT_664461 [Wilcoxina mikolae CBS 423.85]|nr:hypothetical protein K440DRAFT_664461 [Wilcoxina mikolae CBS 423.85]
MPSSSSDHHPDISAQVVSERVISHLPPQDGLYSRLKHTPSMSTETPATTPAKNEDIPSLVAKEWGWTISWEGELDKLLREVLGVVCEHHRRHSQPFDNELEDSERKQQAKMRSSGTAKLKRTFPFSADDFERPHQPLRHHSLPLLSDIQLQVLPPPPGSRQPRKNLAVIFPPPSQSRWKHQCRYCGVFEEVVEHPHCERQFPVLEGEEGGFGIEAVEFEDGGCDEDSGSEWREKLCRRYSEYDNPLEMEPEEKQKRGRVCTKTRCGSPRNTFHRSIPSVLTSYIPFTGFSPGFTPVYHCLRLLRPSAKLPAEITLSICVCVCIFNVIVWATFVLQLAEVTGSVQ